MCIDASKTGDITRTGIVWSFDGIRSSSSTVAIRDGLLYTADAGGNVYCLDADTGCLYWTHKTKPVWASPVVADGKVYVATHGAGLLVFAAGKEMKLLSDGNRDLDMDSSPAVAGLHKPIDWNLLFPLGLAVALLAILYILTRMRRELT